MAGEQPDAAHQFRQRPDHNLLDAQDRPGPHAEQSVAKLHHDEDAPVVLPGGRHAQRLGQMDDRQHLITQLANRPAIDLTNQIGAGVQPDDLIDGRLGNGEALLAAADDDRRDQRRRHQRLGQRDAGGEQRPPARRPLGLDGAAEFLNVGPHHVQADTPARERCDLIAGGETRLKQQVQGRPARQVRRPRGGDEPLADRRLRDAREVDAPAIVLDGEDHLAGSLDGAQAQHADPRLAGRLPLGGRFQPMVQRVADQVRQRVGEGIEHAAVQLQLATADFQAHLPVQLPAQIADQAFAPIKQRADRIHPRPHDRLVDLGDALRQGDKGGIVGETVPGQQLVAGHHHVAGQLQQVVQEFHADAHHLVVVAGGRFGVRCGRHHGRHGCHGGRNRDRPWVRGVAVGSRHGQGQWNGDRRWRRLGRGNGYGSHRNFVAPDQAFQGGHGFPDIRVLSKIG